MSTALHTLAVFEQHINAGTAPGGQLCVSLGGKLMLDAAHGVLAPGERAVTPDTIYDLASLTKVLATTYLAAKLYEQGRADLDVNKLEHCAGYAAHRLFHGDVVAQCRAEPLAYEPRSQSIYSDIGFILLGDDLARVGGPLHEQFQRDRMGVFYLTEVRPSDVIAPTSVVGAVDDENAREMGGVAGHAGLFGTARDVLALGERWLSAWHGTDESFLKQSTVKRFWTASTVPGSTRALGWDRPSPQGSSTGDLWPSDAVGHLGFTGTSLWIAPRQGLVVAMLTNRVVNGRFVLEPIKAMRRAVHSAIFQELTT